MDLSGKKIEERADLKYRTSNRKAQFLVDLDNWQQEVEQWWETVDKCVKTWNNDISSAVKEGIYTEEQAEFFKMENVPPLSRIGLDNIKEIYLTDAISSTLRGQIVITINNYLEEVGMRVREHINKVHNICAYFLDKDKQAHIVNKLTVLSASNASTENLTVKLQSITSLEHAVQSIEDPKEALKYLYSVATNGFEFAFTTSSFNNLVHMLADKIDDGEYQFDSDNENSSQ